MRKFVALILTAGLMAAPAALAQNDLGPAHDNGSLKVAKIAKVKMATFAFSGLVSAVGDGTITITPVRAHGKRSRVALTGATTFTVMLGEKTRITRSGMGRVTLDKVMVGDRVKVEIRAPRGTALAAMPAAKRVKVKAATVVAPAPSTAPSTEVAAAPAA